MRAEPLDRVKERMSSKGVCTQTRRGLHRALTEMWSQGSARTGLEGYYFRAVVDSKAMRGGYWERWS